MAPYKFQSEDFALSETGIHLLRNKFNFKTVSYDQVKKASILREVEIKRPLIMLCIGIALLFFAVKQSLWVFEQLTDPQVYHIYIESIVIPIIPGILGIYCLYSAVRKGPVFKLDADKVVYKLRLRPIFKGKQFPELKEYLEVKLGSKLNIDPSFRFEIKQPLHWIF